MIIVVNISVIDINSIGLWYFNNFVWEMWVFFIKSSGVIMVNINILELNWKLICIGIMKIMIFNVIWIKVVGICGNWLLIIKLIIIVKIKIKNVFNSVI